MFAKRKKLIGLLALLVIIAIIPIFEKSPYYLDLFIIMMMNAVLAMTFILMLRTGLISMGIAAFWGIGAFASALLATKFGVSFWLCLPAAGVITAVFGFILGFPLLKNPGFTFIILTSVIAMIFGVALGNIQWIGGYNGITNIPPPNPISIPFLPPLEFVSKIQFFYLILLLSIVCILILYAFYSAWTGRAWTAIGLNPRLAQSIGVDIFRYKLLGFVVACGIAGLMGSFYAHYESFVTPVGFGIFITIYLQIYAILGGIGYAIIGPIFGSAIMTFFPEFMRITRETGPVFLGVLVIFLILFLPHGLLSLVEKPVVVRFFNRIGKAIMSLITTKSGAGQT